MRFYLLLALLLFSTGAGAEISKWVDAQGNVHYSDGPPPADAKVEPVRIPMDRSLPASANPATDSLAEREAALQKELKAREKAAEQEKKQREAERLKQQNCTKVRIQLKVLQDSPRIATYDANGNRSYIDQATRDQRIAQARQEVSKYCE